MKKRLLFMTLLMLFCTTMFGQHWTMTNADIVKYSFNMTVHADVKIEGVTPDNIQDIEIAAFHNGVLRGVAKPVYKSMLGQYIAELLVYGNDYGDNITFKVFDPNEGKEYDTDYVIKFQEEDVGLSLSPVEMNFYSMHWSYNNTGENYMAYPCVIKIDGVEQENPNLELAAFIDGEVCGVAKPKKEEAIGIYIANLKIDGTDGTNGKTISFKLYVPGVGELETDYTAIYNFDYSGLVTIDFRNNPTAQIKRGEFYSYFSTLDAAVAAAQAGETIELLAVNISEGTVKLPATLKNVTLKGVEGAVLKDMTITASDGNSFNYVGLTFDGIVFDNSRISITGWRNGDETVENLTVTNCIFRNLDDATNIAAVHINKDAAEAVNGFTFTNNVIDGATGGSKSGVYAQVTGKTVFANNVINNVAFRPYVIQLTTNDGIADELTVTGNTFSGSASGRAQGLGSDAAGTDAVTLVVSNNIFKGITEAQQICYWNFNAETTTADLSKNYYDIDILANPGKIYYNSAAENIQDLADMSIFPIYRALKEDGTIDENSAWSPVAVAKIGEKDYYDLQIAVDAAQDGETITMLVDVELAATIKITETKKVILDLNGKTIDGTGKVRIAIMSYGDLTIKDSTEEKNGTVKAGIDTAGNAVNICAGTFTFESGNIYSLNNAILIDEQAATININGGTITAEPNTNNSAAFYISSTSATEVNITAGTMKGYNGILLWNNTKINITGGSIIAEGDLAIQGNGSKDNTEINISGENTIITGKDAAIYHPQGGKLNIAGGIIIGETGIVVKGGVVTISGGTINGTGAANAYESVSSGYKGTGDALYVEHYDNSTSSDNYGTPVVTVTGGTFNSTNAQAVASYANPNNAANGVEALEQFVSGGTYNKAIAEGLVAPGFKLEANADGTYGVVVDPAYGNVAKIGDTYYTTMAEALAAVGAGDVVIEIVNEGATLDYGAREAYGTAETTSLTINGNGMTLTLNQTDSDWSSFGLANADAKVVFNNMTIEKTGKGDTSGEWNTHAIIFSSNVEMTDVTVNNSMAVQAGAALTNVTINEANGYYGLWINGNGQTVTMNNGAINATNGGRGIKVADEYVNDVKQVTLNVTGTTFNTAKKAAVLVSSTKGAKVTANDCDITNVAEDSTNFVWVDEDWAAYYNEVKVYDDATKTQENEASFPIKVWYVNGDGVKLSVRAYYKTLDELFAAPATQVPGSNYIDLRADVAADNKVDVSYSSNRVYTFGTEVEGGVTMTFNFADNWNNLPKFNLGENITMNIPYLYVIGGDIEIAGTINTNYLYLYGTGEGVTITETGIVNANVAEDKTVQVKGGTVLTVNGQLNTSTLNVWTQDVNDSQLIVSGTNANVNASHIHAWNGEDGVSSQIITVEKGATLTSTNLQADRGSIVNVDAATLTAGTFTLGYEGNVGTLNVTNNGVITNAVTINSVGSTVIGPEGMNVVVGTGEVLEGYMVVYKDGVYGIAEIVAAIGETNYASLQEAIDAATEGQTVKVVRDITLTETLNIAADKVVTLDLNGMTISQTKAQTAGYEMILNDGNLTIVDNTEYKEGKISYTDSGNGGEYVSNTITNRGTITVVSGTIENLSSQAVAQRGYPYAIDSSIWGSAAEVNTVVEGGKVCGATYSAIRMRTDSNTKAVNVTVTGGEIVGTIEVHNPSSTVAGKGTLTISGGKLSNSGTANVLFFFGFGASAENIVANVTGGEFTGNITMSTSNPIGAGFDKNFIYGGTFSTNVNDYCAFGYECYEIEAGKFGIKEKANTEIRNLTELEAFRDAVNAGNTFSGQTVVLSYDVNLAELRAANNWEPIGTPSTPFKGTFDGGNKTISNLVVEGENNVGLFGYATSATIKNVKINNANVKGTDCVGAIAGQVYSTSLIDNCHVSGSIQVEGQTNVGGIVGKYYTKVKNCSVIGDEVATSYVKGTYKASDFEGDNIGGIMGHGGENNRFENNTVKNITISGTRKVAGIVGVTDMNTQVKNCVVENVNIETTATAEYANSKKNSMSNGTLVGSYTTGNNTTGTVESCVVKNVNFLNPNNAVVSVGPITGGLRGGTDGMLPPTGVTASGNNIYMSTISGSNNLYLMDAVAKIGETEYYTLFDAVAAADGATIITMLRNTTEEFAIDNTTANITFDMAGFTLNGAILPSKADLTINGGKIINNNSGVSAIEINEGSLALNDVNIESKRHGVRIDGNVEATIEGGEYRPIGVQSQTQYTVNVSGGAVVTIKKGTFVGPRGLISDSGSALRVKPEATVIIEGGDFSGGKNVTISSDGNLTITGGTYDQDVTTYCAEGYVCQMNADGKYEVFFAVAKIDNTYYPSLQAAFNAVEANETITIISNVEEGTITLPASLKNVVVTANEGVVVANTAIKTPAFSNDVKDLNYEGITFDGITFDNSYIHVKGWASNASNQTASFRNWTINNCVFKDLATTTNENTAAVHINVASEEFNGFTFTNNTINGVGASDADATSERAALYGNNFQGTVIITGNTIENTSGSSMVVEYGNADVTISNNVLKNWAVKGGGRAIRLNANNNTTLSTISVTYNAMIIDNAPEEFVKATGGNTTLALNENYWNGFSPREVGMVTAEGTVIDNYYADYAIENGILVLKDLVVFAKGTITPGYVSATRIWGEGGSNSKSSFVVEVYAGDTKLGQASLNNVDGIINGNVYVTWGIPYNPANTDEYWTVEWFEDLKPSVVPTAVKLYVDGEMVAENVVKMSAPDDLNPMPWEDIFVAQIGDKYYTSLQDAVNAGGDVTILRNINLTSGVTVAADKVVTLNLNGFTITGTPSEAAAYAVITNKGDLTIDGNGAIVCDHKLAGSTAYAVNTIVNSGILTVKAGTIENKSTSGNQIGYAIDNNSTTGNAVVYIEGGKVTVSGSSVYYDGIRQFCNSLTNENSVIISGGEVSSLWMQNPSDGATERNTKDVKGSFAISGGTLNALYIEPSAAFEGAISGGHIANVLRFDSESADSERLLTGFITGGTFSMDVNEYCHEYYDAIEGDNGIWTIEQVLFAQTTALQKGWNWYSSYINLSSSAGLEKLQNALAGNGTQIKGKTGYSSYEYIGDVNGEAQYKWYSSEDFVISAKQMYMINTTAAVEIMVDGKVVNPAATPISLKSGWNWIGYPMEEVLPINVALANVNAEEGDVIKSRAGESEYIDGYGWDGELLTLEPGVGYMYFSQKNTSFTYSDGNNGAKYENENITSDNNHWIPETSQYASNMSIVAMMYVDGEIVNDNYEIAAFANGECRGSARPVYIEGLDAYMLFMNVFGEESDELSFKYYDVIYETEYELDDVVIYSADSRLGSARKPYMFTMNITGVDEASLSEINIYPNPTTIGSEINLQATCDKVEVFNALGVKIAEYQNVDSIDALETAGIYVIRITDNNEVKHCRLIVK